jgi:PRTRC genetic system ThiF family protein
MDIDTSYARARKLAIGNSKELNLILVGCGGTGSWLAPSVVRAAKVLTEKISVKVNVTFIDPDLVEEKNVYRQNFCLAEIGANKAETLALRYSSAWGLPFPIHALVMEFAGAWKKIESQSYGNALTVILGCVDNPVARKQIADAFKGGSRNSDKIPSLWWIDSGNEHANGQILIGSDSEDKGGFPIKGYCTRLPLPSVQHPELISRAEVVRPKASTTHLSCADLALLDAQSLTINQRMAAEMSDFLFRAVVIRDLDRYATYLNLKSGTTRSNYITPENIASVYRQVDVQEKCLMAL